MPCYRIDIAVLLGKTPPSSSSETENPPMEAAHPPSLSQSLVFSNSKQGVPLSQTSSSTPYTQHSMVRLLRKTYLICLSTHRFKKSSHLICGHYVLIRPNRASLCVIAIIVSHNVPILQVSMLNKSFGDVGDPKGVSTGTTGSQFLEQYKTAQALAQLAAQHSQTGPPNTAPSSWDTGATSLGQFGEVILCY